MNITAKLIELIRDAYDLAVFLFPKGVFGFAMVYVFGTMATTLIALGGALGLVAVYVFGTLATALIVVRLGKIVS